MIQKILDNLIAQTEEELITWRSSSNPFEFYTYYENKRYSVERIQSSLDFRVNLNVWNEKGDPQVVSIEKENDKKKLIYLFEGILKRNEDLNLRYNTYKHKLNKEMEQNKNISISLHKIKSRLSCNTEKERPIIRINENESFYYKTDNYNEIIPKYVEPLMSQIPTAKGCTDFNNANVVLISAPGATGKTAMSEYLSQMNKIPIFNLGKHEAVGANSISGVIMQQIFHDDIFIYYSGLRDGTCSMILDGLDEAAIRITYESFESFLKNIAFFAKDSIGLPFIILGRPGVMEDAALILEENNVNVSLLQIEPFTIKKAKDFIDNQLPKEYIRRYEQQYIDVRDYIIDQIGGFFKDESELNKKLFEHFIGYAPVLQSISNLLNEERNYSSLLKELKENKKQKIDLLIDIVERILQREKLKIEEEVLPQLFDANRSLDFRNKIKEIAGSIDDQCIRVLGYLQGEKIEQEISDDSEFNKNYNQKVNDWIKNHPFINLNEKKIQNIVFESYLIAKIITKEDRINDALKYMSKTNSCSYILLDIYSAINKMNSIIDYRLFPYLYKSFKALDLPQNIGTTEIIINERYCSDNKTLCTLNFIRNEEEPEFEFEFEIKDDENLEIPSPLSSIYVDAPINLNFSERQIDIQSSIEINCSKLNISSEEILFSTNNPENSNKSIVWECDSFEVESANGKVPLLIFRNPTLRKNFLLFTDSIVNYPFNEFKKSKLKLDDNKDLTEAYQKLRRMLLMFRSHKKGILARCCSKIDSRIGKTDSGKKIIDKLIEKKVLKKDNNFYIVDYDKFAEVLGSKYDDIRSSVVNDKIKEFLSSINS